MVNARTTEAMLCTCKAKQRVQSDTQLSLSGSAALSNDSREQKACAFSMYSKSLRLV